MTQQQTLNCYKWEQKMLTILSKDRGRSLQDNWLREKPSSSFYWEPVHSRPEENSTVLPTHVPKPCLQPLQRHPVASLNNKNGRKRIINMGNCFQWLMGCITKVLTALIWKWGSKRHLFISSSISFSFTSPTLLLW